MAQFTGQSDEQFAVGAVIGGGASLTGSTVAMGTAKFIAAKCAAAGLTAGKVGISIGLGLNPIGASIVSGRYWLFAI